MAEPEHPTRQSLLDAGLALAEVTPLAALPIDQIVRDAGVAKGTFYVHFKGRAEYLTALHRRFHDWLRARIDEACLDAERGADWLRCGTIAYLDGCLQARGVKAMLLQARGLPEIGRAVTDTNDRFAHDLETDFAVLGVAHPREAARLYVAMAAEVALLELDANEPLPALRSALFAYVGIAG